MSAALVLVASCSLAENSAAEAAGIFNITPSLAAASPVPARMVWAVTPWRTSMVIICWKSAVVPGRVLPRRSARALIWSNS